MEEQLSDSERLVLQQQKQRKSKDEARFFSYLLIRCGVVAASIYVTGKTTGPVSSHQVILLPSHNI